MSDRREFSLFIFLKKESVRCSVVSNSETLWSVICQVPLSMGFSRQQYWSGMPLKAINRRIDKAKEYVVPHQYNPSVRGQSGELGRLTSMG